jgi:hypothetical protein
MQPALKEQLDLLGVPFFCWSVDQLFALSVVDDKELHPS